MLIENDIHLDFDDVLIRPKRTPLESRKQVSLEREFTFLHSGETWSGIPIIASNMDTVGTFEMANSLMEYNMMTAIHKFYDFKSWVDFAENTNKIKMEKLVSPTIGMNDISNYHSIIEELKDLEVAPAFLTVDVANGYTERFVNLIKEIREELENSVTIIAGNVATPEAVEALLFAGADIVKIGIGPSKICDTRIKTGVGVPQLTAVIECADAAHGLRGHIIADGGCKQPGDIAKAFGAGADFVMIGSMLAGHNESGGEEKTELVDSFAGIEVKYKEVYGMSSEHAMKKHYGEKSNYRSSEGNHRWIEHRGPVKNTIEDILGGLRSACTYVGAENLKGLPRCTTFMRVNRIK